MKFRDVIRHYIGCQVQTTTEISPDDCDWGIDRGEIMTLVGINSNGDIGDDTISNIDTYGVVLKQGDKWVGTHISDIKPLLLSLEDMTLEDGKAILTETFFPHTDYPLSDFKKTLVGQKYNNPRFSINNDWYDCELTFGSKTGAVWSAKDTIATNVKIKATVFAYLCNKHYDVFGLIDSGEAIRKTV